MIAMAVILGAVFFLANLSLAIFFHRLYNREKQKFISQIRAFFESPNKETPSYFASVTDNIAGQFAYRLSTTLKATFMGVQSGEAKQGAKLQEALSLDLLTQKSPMAGAILTSFPAVQKLVKSNPALGEMAASMLANMGKNKGEGGGGDDGNPFALGKQF